MSTPPYDPNAGSSPQWSLPQDPNAGVPQQPQYGQQPPAAPQFGAPQPPFVPQQPQGAPQYGQMPGYPQPQPGYPQPPYPPQAGPYNQYAPYGGAGYGAPGAALASWGARVGAALIDALILVPVFIIAMIVAASSATPATYDPDTGTISGGGISGAGMAIVVLLYLGGLAFGLYQLYRQGTTGQTIGKKVVGIKVVREADGQFTGFGMAFVRGLAHILDGFPCYIGYLWPLWDAKNQTFADKVIGTVVVTAK